MTFSNVSLIYCRHLDSNLFEFLDSDILAAQDGLQLLELGNNYISHFPTLTGPSTLRALSLFNNIVETFGIQAFSALGSLTHL